MQDCRGTWRSRVLLGLHSVTAHRIAQQPKAAFVAGLRPSQLPGRAACQLPDQSTIVRVRASLTDGSRPWGARSFASKLPCPLSRPLSTAPDISTPDRDPSACRFPAPVLQTTGTAAAAPASWLRSIWRHVTHVRSPTIQNIDCNKLASDLRPGCWSGFLFDRSLAKDRAGTAGSRPPTERWLAGNRITCARSPSASKSTRKKFGSWGRKAYCCAPSSPLQAQERRVLAFPVLYRSGAPRSTKMGTIASL